MKVKSAAELENAVEYGVIMMLNKEFGDKPVTTMSLRVMQMRAVKTAQRIREELEIPSSVRVKPRVEHRGDGHLHVTVKVMAPAGSFE